MDIAFQAELASPVNLNWRRFKKFLLFPLLGSNFLGLRGSFRSRSKAGLNFFTSYRWTLCKKKIPLVINTTSTVSNSSSVTTDSLKLKLYISIVLRDCAIIIRRGGGAEKLELSSKNLDSTPPPKQKKLALTPLCYVKNNVPPPRFRQSIC